MSVCDSRITQTFGVRGIGFLRDGLPISNASGGPNPELVDPNTGQHVDGFSDAYALEDGSVTLRGTVYCVSRTGGDTPGFTLAMLTDAGHTIYRP